MPKPEISTVLLLILVMYEAGCPDQAAQSGTLTASDSLFGNRSEAPAYYVMHITKSGPGRNRTCDNAAMSGPRRTGRRRKPRGFR